MTRTTYPYLHGGHIGGLANYAEFPFDNWEKNGAWVAANSPGVTFSAKGFPQTNPNDYPTHINTFYYIQGNISLIPLGNYYVKTDPHITLTAFGATINQTGLTGAQIAAGLWKLTVTQTVGNQALFCNLGGTGPLSGSPMTHIRIRPEAVAGVVPASIYADDPVWRASFLTAYANFGCVRFMDWGMTNDPSDIPTASIPTTWAGRVTKDSFSWSQQGSRGCPVEVMVNLCNTLNCDGWFNFHYYATPDYITGFAQYVHDNLNAGLVAHFEHSNEVWNYAFYQTSFATTEGNAKANAGDPNYLVPTTDGGNSFVNMLRAHSARIKAAALIVNSVYADRPQSKRNAIAFQGVLSFTGQTKAAFNYCSQACDVYSPTSYFYPNMSNMSADPEWAALGDGVRGSTAWYAALKASCRIGLDSVITQLRSHAVDAHALNLEMAVYEGGQHLINTTYTPEIKVFNASQDMGDLFALYISALRGIPGVLFNWFCVAAPWSNFGCFGLKEYTSDADTPKFTAVNTDAANRTVQTVKRGSRKTLSF